MILLIESCDLNLTQLEAFIATELCALAALIMDTEAPEKNLSHVIKIKSTLSQEGTCKMTDYVWYSRWQVKVCFKNAGVVDTLGHGKMPGLDC